MIESFWRFQVQMKMFSIFRKQTEMTLLLCFFFCLTFKAHQTRKIKINFRDFSFLYIRGIYPWYTGRFSYKKDM
jgi:hypothetical protein